MTNTIPETATSVDAFWLGVIDGFFDNFITLWPGGMDLERWSSHNDGYRAGELLHDLVYAR